MWSTRWQGHALAALPLAAAIAAAGGASLSAPAAAQPAPTAQAQPRPQYDEREMRAREAFAVGRYSDALDLFGKLYAETMHPTYLRNIGRCYQNLGEPDKAIASFREYLRQARGLTPEQRAQIDDYVKEMEELKRRRDQERAAPTGGPTATPTRTPEEAAVTSAAATPPPAPPPTAPAPPEAKRAVDVAAEHRPAPRADDGRGTRKVIALSLAGAGAVGVALGTVFGLKARAQDSDARKVCPTGVCSDQSEITRHDRFVADAKSNRTRAIVGFAVGGAALAAAGVVFLTARGAGGAGDARVALWAAEGQGGLFVQGRW
jgi:tetratricopeptide (TPR) repeat protein